MKEEMKKEEMKKEEVKIIDSKVLNFSIGVVALLAIVICTILSIALHTATSLYIKKSQDVIQQEKTISILQRALDRAEGRLSVYDAFLIKRNIDTIRSLIAKFQRDKHVNLEKVTVHQFEQFVQKTYPEYIGVGGK